MLSESTEMYLVAVYRLTRHQPETTIRAIADQLGVAMSSTSEKVRTLTEQGYLMHAWREGVSLTERGHRIALQVLRKNRLACTFLVQALGYPLDEALEDACHLEHAISSRLAERLAVFLDNPAVDPFGQPIPDNNGNIDPSPVVSLLTVPVGQTVTVRRLETYDRERVRYLQTIGLLPGTTMVVAEVVPFEGPLMVQLEHETVAVARLIATDVSVVLQHEDEGKENA